MIGGPTRRENDQGWARGETEKAYWSHLLWDTTRNHGRLQCGGPSAIRMWDRADLGWSEVTGAQGAFFPSQPGTGRGIYSRFVGHDLMIKEFGRIPRLGVVWH